MLFVLEIGELCDVTSLLLAKEPTDRPTAALRATLTAPLTAAAAGGQLNAA